MATKKKPTAEKKEYRKELPPERCAFCKNVTDVERECEGCGVKCYGTCSKCHALGAPRIHVPRKMTRVLTKTGEMRMCYPFCTRKLAYCCRNCNKWVDKTLLHAFSRQETNGNMGLCEPCAKETGQTVCASCHGITPKRESRRDANGYRCDRCSQYTQHYISHQKSFDKPVIISKKCDRTFGLELEINNVAKQADLSKIIANINVKGVGFSVKGDGSVHNGFEIVSVPAERRALASGMKELCDVINKFAHDYSGSGLHVHIKDEKLPPADAFKTWLALEKLTFGFIHPSRERNGYGGSIVNRLSGINAIGRRTQAGDPHLFPRGMTIEDAIDYIENRTERALEIQGGRYASMNLCALSKYGTIEIRCHEATGDFTTITHWLKYLDAVFAFAGKIGKDKGALLDVFNAAKEAREDKEGKKALSLLKDVGLSETSRVALVERFKTFAAGQSFPAPNRQGNDVIRSTHSAERIMAIPVRRNTRRVPYGVILDREDNARRRAEIERVERQWIAQEEHDARSIAHAARMLNEAVRREVRDGRTMNNARWNELARHYGDCYVPSHLRDAYTSGVEAFRPASAVPHVPAVEAGAAERQTEQVAASPTPSGVPMEAPDVQPARALVVEYFNTSRWMPTQAPFNEQALQMVVDQMEQHAVNSDGIPLNSVRTAPEAQPQPQTSNPENLPF